MKSKTTLAILLSTCLLLPLLASAGKPAAGGSFTFSYDVGPAPGYHVYGFATLVSAQPTQPPGTIRFNGWWVWDLGAVSGVGTVSCPKPLKPFTDGSLFFANTADEGATDGITFPAAMVTKYNRGESVEIYFPDGLSVDLFGSGLPYWNASLGPVDFSSYFNP